MLSLSVNTYYATMVGRQADAVQASMEKLSSGVRINHASDDAAGLSIAETLHAQVVGSQQAISNIQEANNIMGIAQDGVQGLVPILQRIRTLILQSANGTNTNTDRAAMQSEIDAIKGLMISNFQEAHNARINLDGNPSDRILDFQVGANPGDIISADFNPLHDVLYSMILGSFGYSGLYTQYNQFLTSMFGTPVPPPATVVAPFAPLTLAQAFPQNLTVNPGTTANITGSMALVDTSLQGLDLQAAYLGAVSNQLTHTLNSVTSYQINVAQSESTIRDTDMAAEVTSMTRSQILQQSATAMLAQSNSQALSILQLLKGG
jgi:flagellin